MKLSLIRVCLHALGVFSAIAKESVKVLNLESKVATFDSGDIYKSMR
jgi:hypothetical protein